VEPAADRRFFHDAEPTGLPLRRCCRRRDGARRGRIGWAPRESAGLTNAARIHAVPPVRIEDGFLRSAELGSDFLPGKCCGYRTLCLHPFDWRFFWRDWAMPALGFEAFLGEEPLGGGLRGAIPSCRACSPDTRWQRIAGLRLGVHTKRSCAVAEARRHDLTLDGLRRSDEMIHILRAAGAAR